MAVAPHNPLGPVCGAVCQHLDAVIPNAVIQEEARGVVGWYDEIAEHEMLLEDSSWPLPKRPGLGVEINERAAAKHPYQPEAPERSLRYGDGTLLYW
jgi:galactonate dehydratase